MVTATLNPPNKLVAILTPIVSSKAKRSLISASALVPSFVQDNFIDQGTRGKSGQNRWARVSRRQLIWRKTYPHSGSPEQKERYYREAQPLRDTGTLFNSFKSGKLTDVRDGFAIAVRSTTDYGWRHEFGEGQTPDGQPLWYRPHMYLWAEHDAPILFAEFARRMGK